MMGILLARKKKTQPLQHISAECNPVEPAIEAQGNNRSSSGGHGGDLLEFEARTIAQLIHAGNLCLSQDCAAEVLPLLTNQMAPHAINLEEEYVTKVDNEECVVLRAFSGQMSESWHVPG
jgi:hypothetical protein